MPLLTKGRSTHFLDHEEVVLRTNIEHIYRLSPCIVTLCEGVLTDIDVQNFIEMGLRIVRFRMTHITRNDKLKLMTLLKRAVKWCCEKYEVSTWPIAISIDIPNACIRTGYLKEDLDSPTLKEDCIVKITSELKYWNKCDHQTIFIDDPYTINTIKPGAEITLVFGDVVMTCTEILNKVSIKCKIIKSGCLQNADFVCIRGIKLKRPPFTKKDLELIALAKEFEVDIVTMNSIRRHTTVKKVKSIFGEGHKPLIISTICEQEGLDDIDAIIEESDGIILAREFLAHEIVNKHQMTAIQLQIGAKCKQRGKPFYISGNILEQTLLDGSISASDLSDITNAVLQGAGFVLRNYSDPSNVVKAMEILDSVCRSVEAVPCQYDMWRMCAELRVPVNAASACILSCALLTKCSGSTVVILPTVTGRTAIQLVHMSPEAIILTISSNPVVARQLLLYRGVIPIVYDKVSLQNWYEEMDARCQFAVTYAVKHNLLKYGQSYITLRKSTPTSAFCDNVSVWKVVTMEDNKNTAKFCGGSMERIDARV